jgi:DNA-binding NarL/FixJ family response regulator
MSAHGASREALRADVLLRPNGEFLVLSIPLPRPPEAARLTPAERQVLDLLLRGRSNAAIAGRLGRATRTVANQVAAIFQKLGVNSRGELAAVLGGGT